LFLLNATADAIELLLIILNSWPIRLLLIFKLIIHLSRRLLFRTRFKFCVHLLCETYIQNSWLKWLINIIKKFIWVLWLWAINHTGALIGAASAITENVGLWGSLFYFVSALRCLPLIRTIIEAGISLPLSHIFRLDRCRVVRITMRVPQRLPTLLYTRLKNRILWLLIFRGNIIIPISCLGCIT